MRRLLAVVVPLLLAACDPDTRDKSGIDAGTAHADAAAPIADADIDHDASAGDAVADGGDASIADAGNGCSTFTDAPDSGPFSSAIVERVSVASNVMDGDGQSASPDVSADGRWVVFASFARNLVSDDTNELRDVFVRDRLTGTTKRVSVATDCTEADGDSYWPAISGDGRVVAFASTATTLVAGDTNQARDVFVHDLLSGVTARVSIASDGSEANDASLPPDLSNDGRLITFGSHATNLVPGDTTAAPDYDVFVHDRMTMQTTRVNLSPAGDEAPGTSDVAVISADGRFVAFGSSASNLVAGDTNDQSDVFIRDLQLEETTLVSVNSAGGLGDGLSFISNNSVSPDGRFVAFRSHATNFDPAATLGYESVFVRDLLLGTTTLVSHASDGSPAGEGNCCPPSISGDGRYVAFTSYAENLVVDDMNRVADGFIRDLSMNTLVRLIPAPGAEPNGALSTYVLSLDGRSLVFDTSAANVVSGDGNDTWDVFAMPNPL